MFVGTIPSDMQKIVREIVKDWDCTDIYVGTSGNFTIERTIHDLGFGLHSNDVTLYSSVIGSYLAGNIVPFEFNEEYSEEYGWLKDYLDTPEDRVATILLTTRIMGGLGKENHPYYGKMKEAYRLQWPELHQKTKEKVKKLTVRLKSYTAGDVYDWVDDIPDDQGVICYPPFFGESGDYEKYFKNLETLFLWQPPKYEYIYGERLMEFFRKLTKKKHWLFGSKEKLEEFRPYLRGMTKTTNRGVPIYVYSNSEKRRVVTPRQKTELILNPHLQPDQDLGERLTIAPLTVGQFSQIRSQYMNHNIRPGQPWLSFAVLVDGVIVGAFAFLSPRGSTTARWESHVPTPHAYLLSDFPVANSKYKKLAKLVLYAVLSKETKMLLERYGKTRVRSIITTAFTDKSVSMKYRGLFKLLNRKEAGNKSDKKYELNYGALAGQWTLQEGYEEWKKRHGETW